MLHSLSSTSTTSPSGHLDCHPTGSTSANFPIFRHNSRTSTIKLIMLNTIPYISSPLQSLNKWPYMTVGTVENIFPQMYSFLVENKFKKELKNSYECPTNCARKCKDGQLVHTYKRLNRVKLNGVTSSCREALRGCPQGSSFGPLLWNMFQSK